QLVTTTFVGICVIMRHQYCDGSVHRFLHTVVDDGIVTIATFRRQHIQDHAVCRGNVHGLESVADVLGVTVVPHAVPDAGNRVQGNRLVDGRIDVENTYALAGFGFQCKAGVLIVYRVVVENLTVDQGVLPTG